MILDVHIAFLVAALSVMFGLTFSIGQFLDYKINEVQKRKNQLASSDLDAEAFNA